MAKRVQKSVSILEDTTSETTTGDERFESVYSQCSMCPRRSAYRHLNAHVLVGKKTIISYHANYKKLKVK